MCGLLVFRLVHLGCIGRFVVLVGRFVVLFGRFVVLVGRFVVLFGRFVVFFFVFSLFVFSNRSFDCRRGFGSWCGHCVFDRRVSDRFVRRSP